MRFLSIVGNSLGCSASGERLVSAARDGDFLEAKALLEDNPRLVKYSTNGVKNSPLHYSAAQGHHEVCPTQMYYVRTYAHLLKRLHALQFLTTTLIGLVLHRLLPFCLRAELILTSETIAGR